VKGTRRSPRYDVCFYAPWIGPLLAERTDLPPGGAETQILLLTQALAEVGHRVAIVAIEVDGLPREVGRVDVIAQPRPAHRLPVLRTTAAVRSTASALRRADARVVVQRSAGAITGLIALLARAQRRRFVYSSANVIDFEFERLEGRRTVRLFHLGVRLAHHVVVQTEEQAQLCRARFGREPSVIRNLAEPAELTREEPEFFLWVGRLTHYKRPEAFLALAREVHEAQFKMVGVPFHQEGEQLAEDIRRDAASLPNLELLDPRPRRELMRLVDRAVAMVNTAEFEGMPNIFLEAWSRGVPALAFSHDPDGVVAQNGLGAFAGGDPATFADQARELWAGRGSREGLSAHCRAYVADQHAPAAVGRRWAAALGL
jgi:glycosyltransferase involved in cell wall biosynthesis